MTKSWVSLCSEGWCQSCCMQFEKNHTQNQLSIFDSQCNHCYVLKRIQTFIRFFGVTKISAIHHVKQCPLPVQIDIHPIFPLQNRKCLIRNGYRQSRRKIPFHTKSRSGSIFGCSLLLNGSLNETEIWQHDQYVCYVTINVTYQLQKLQSV